MDSRYRMIRCISRHCNAESITLSWKRLIFIKHFHRLLSSRRFPPKHCPFSRMWCWRRSRRWYVVISITFMEVVVLRNDLIDFLLRRHSLHQIYDRQRHLHSLRIRSIVSINSNPFSRWEIHWLHHLRSVWAALILNILRIRVQWPIRIQWIRCPQTRCRYQDLD